MQQVEEPAACKRKETMTHLSLYLLGPARVKLDEVIIEVKPRKALALLIYLAVTAERHPRDSLATLLWPHSD